MEMDSISLESKAAVTAIPYRNTPATVTPRRPSGWGDDVEIRQLQYFTAIVREGSFSRAARRLHVGQPALSKQIRALERELGVDLLVRLAAGVRPTLAGARLAEMSQKFLDYADEMASAVRATTASVTGTITLGLSPSLVPVLAEHLQRRLAEELPQVRITIVEALSMFLEEWLAEDRLDLGVFTRSPHLAGAHLAFTDVGTDEIMLVGTAKLLDEVGRVADADTLAALRLALTPGFRDILYSRPELAATARDVGARIDSVHLVRDLVVRGEFCSALPFTFVHADLDEGTLVGAGFEPALNRTVVAATRAGRASSPAIRVVVEMVRDRLAEFAAIRRANRRQAS